MKVQQAQAQRTLYEPAHIEPPGRGVELWDLEMVAHIEMRSRHDVASDQRSQGRFAVEWIGPLEDKAGFLGSPRGFIRIDYLDHLASRISRQRQKANGLIEEEALEVLSQLRHGDAPEAVSLSAAAARAH